MIRLIIILFTLAGLSASAQVQVTGRVIDGESGEALVGATVLFRLVKDTTQTSFVSTNADGRFKLSLPAEGFYRMELSYIGFESFTRILRISGAEYSMPDISISRSTEVLSEVRVTDKPIVVMQKGDTTAFLASGFKTNPDASADDLLKKMPGVVIDGNGVQAQGENVQRVLVDGREFFGNDPMATLRNLPAEVIERIEVFDQLSEQAQFSGYDDGNTVKTINIVTRPETRNGSFGRVYGGFGTDQHYSAGGNINFFNDTRRISVVGLSNDINIQNFSGEDLVGVASSSMSGRGRGGMSGGGGFSRNSSSNFLTAQQNGISTVHSLGLNYVDEFMDGDFKVTGSYFFNRGLNTNDQVSRREYFLSEDSSYFYDESSLQTVSNYNHRLNARVEYRISERHMLVLTPSLSFQDNSNQLLSQVLTTSMEGDSLSGSNNVQDNSLQGRNFTNNLVYRYAFSKRGRSLSFRLRNTYLENDGLLRLDAVNYFQRNGIQSDTLSQETERYSQQRSYDANLTYTEPISEKIQLQLTQAYARSTNTSDNRNFNLMEEDRPLNPVLSNVFESQYSTLTSTAGLSARMEGGFIRLSMAYQHAVLDNEQTFPESGELKRSFNNLLPSLFGRWNLSREKNLRFFYRTSTDAPSISQLQNVVDNSNPILLTTGNPELDQAYAHRGLIRYSNTNQGSSSGFFAFLSAQYSDDFISNETIVAEEEDIIIGDILLRRGSQLTRPVNLDGYWNLRSLVTYSIPSGFMKSVLNLTGGFNYIRTPGLINGQLNTSNNFGLTLGIVIASNISERIDFNIGYSGNFNLVDNSLQPALNDNFLNSSFTSSLNWIFGKGWVFRTDLNYQRYDGLSEGFNQNYTLWNASFGRKFLKNDQAEISVRIFDILRQNQSISRTVTETYIQDATSVVLQRYVMVNLLYVIRNYTGDGK